MRTTMDLPVDLLQKAAAAAGVKTKTQAIILALSEFVARRESHKVLALKGSMRTPYDYKALRRKR